MRVEQIWMMLPCWGVAARPANGLLAPSVSNAIRGGNIVGDHTVAFISDTETVELTHHAVDRELFASGSTACRSLAGR